MMQATTALSLTLPTMTCLPRLSRAFTKSQFLLHAHAPIARERARDHYMFAQRCDEQTIGDTLYLQYLVYGGKP
jgi:hypothetical protein